MFGVLILGYTLSLHHFYNLEGGVVQMNALRKNKESNRTYFLRQRLIFRIIYLRVLQLNKCETDPYFLQNFQCTTMFISPFCKICELNTEREIVFVLTPVDSQGDITQV